MDDWVRINRGNTSKMFRFDLNEFDRKSAISILSFRPFGLLPLGQEEKLQLMSYWGKLDFFEMAHRCRHPENCLKLALWHKQKLALEDSLFIFVNFETCRDKSR